MTVSVVEAASHRSSSCMTCLAIGAATTPPWLCAPWTFSSVTAIATFGVRARREADEPRLVDALRDVQLGGAGLAGDLDALERRADAGALAHDVAHHLRELAARSAPTSRARPRSGSMRSTVRPSASTIRLGEARLHPHAAVGDRRRDRRHLQRRHAQALLADRRRGRCRRCSESAGISFLRLGRRRRWANICESG